MNEIMVRYLQEELRKRPRLSNGVLAWQRSGGWIDCGNETLLDGPTTSRLAKRPPTRWAKLGTPWQGFLWLPKIDVVLILSIGAKTHDDTLIRLQKEFEECHTAATKVYYANHDPLTGALTRHGFQWISERHFTESQQKVQQRESINQPEIGSIQYAVYSFDLDNFKGINDTHGHDAGDAVLAIFADRINKLTKELEKSYKAKFIFGRPGGEEFILLALGRLNKSAVLQISEQLLQAIRTPSLPSPEELKILRRTHPNLLKAGKELPISVTASIGISRMRTGGTAQPWDKIIALLKDQADVALYRAKSDGRNCARLYEHVRLVHGRIFEFHPDSDLAIIDIGTAVGVSPGHTYRVFSPPFVGSDIPFSDGRTNKVIGKYSMIEAGRLLVFETQKDISICVPIDRINGFPFPKGALLHYVPIGSKPILESRPRRRQIGMGFSDGPLENYIESLLANDELQAVIRVRGRYGENSDSRFEEVVAGLHLVFPPGTRFFGMNGYGLYVVLRRDEQESIDEKKAEIKSLLESLGKFIAGIRAGIFLPELLPQGSIPMTSESILFFCTAAANVSLQQQELAAFFDSDTPHQTINYWRQKHLIEDALADYEQFLQYGFSTAELHNTLAVAIIESDSSEYHSLAEAAATQAHRMHPDTEVYKLNLGVAQTITRKYGQAFEVLSTGSAAIDNLSDGAPYVLALAKSAIECKKDGKEISDDMLTSLVLSGANQLAYEDPFQEWLEQICEYKANHLGT